MDETTIQCPRCGADAVYAYGRIKNGKQRYLCLICNRQFVPGKKYPLADQRPRCPNCDGSMHIYRRSSGVIRFRCADYPGCNGYCKTEV
jgi:transposase-like protein